MWKTLTNAFKIKEVRKRIIYTFLILIVVRIGAQLPIPGVNTTYFATWFASQSGTAFNFFDAMTGGSFTQLSVFALSITPYITSSIIIQLLTIAIPKLEEIQKEGEEGRKFIAKLTRYVTIGLALIESTAMTIGFGRSGLLVHFTWYNVIIVIVTMTTGSAMLMWLGERITDKGIGNGISIILFANIVSRLPSMIHNLWSAYLTSGNAGKIILGIGVIIVSLAATALIVFITDSERRLPIQYAKKVVGRKMYGGQSSTLPLKVNMTGVMPMIFANSIVSIPATIQMFVNPKQGSFWAGFFNLFGTDGWLYAALTAILIVAFAYFYVTISFNPIEVANNLKKNGGFIPGIRPGKPTSDYITKVLSRITLIGALFLVVIAVVPLVANIISGAKLSSLAFTGSSIIIVVGVVLETAREIESQMTMRHYKGFLE